MQYTRSLDYEVDFLPVGDGERSGDAIAARIGNLSGPRHEQTVIVVDGGFQDDGDALVEHIVRYYRTDTVDFVINTHPDQDHTAGLISVVEQLHVGEVWMHDPWSRTSTTPEGLDTAQKLRDAALDAGIPLREPFAGLANYDRTVVILGPSEAFYQQQLDDFPRTDAEKAIAKLTSGVGAVLTRVRETLLGEDLPGGDTGPRNNSSVITMLDAGDRQVLVTGDAGIPALSDVLDRAEPHGGLPTFHRILVPHHGSRRNVNSAVLDRLLGPIGQPLQGAGIASASAASTTHPRKRVTNAFHRRGYPVTATKGQTICTSRGGPPRAGWGPVDALPFFDEIDDEDDS